VDGICRSVRNRTTYRRASRLFEELGLARAYGTYTRLLGKIARMDVLVIDDWGFTPVRDSERSDLLEVLEDRYVSRSTIMTSQLSPERWHDYLGDPTLADAICDRVLHHCVTVSIRGESYRLKEKVRAGLVKKREKVEA
jgi:DNA replication protein DnaC